MSWSSRSRMVAIKKSYKIILFYEVEFYENLLKKSFFGLNIPSNEHIFTVLYCRWCCVVLISPNWHPDTNCILPITVQIWLKTALRDVENNFSFSVGRKHNVLSNMALIWCQAFVFFSWGHYLTVSCADVCLYASATVYPRLTGELLAKSSKISLFKL